MASKARASSPSSSRDSSPIGSPNSPTEIRVAARSSPASLRDAAYAAPQPTRLATSSASAAAIRIRRSTKSAVVLMSRHLLGQGHDRRRPQIERHHQIAAVAARPGNVVAPQHGAHRPVARVDGRDRCRGERHRIAVDHPEHGHPGVGQPADPLDRRRMREHVRVQNRPFEPAVHLHKPRRRFQPVEPGGDQLVAQRGHDVEEDHAHGHRHHGRQHADQPDTERVQPWDHPDGSQLSRKQ